jgi:Spy/CpxP family protein refolding chaperone
MKTLHFSAIIAIVLLLASSGNALSQLSNQKQGVRGPKAGPNFDTRIPNLTEEQQSKIKEIRVAHLKEVQALQNQMGELKARQKTLSTAEKPDQKAIDANIDEITKNQNQLMKKSAATHQKIRALLTDEQKLWFDNHAGRKQMHKGMRKGDCPYMGNGTGQGRGDMGRQRGYRQGGNN